MSARPRFRLLFQLLIVFLLSPPVAGPAVFAQARGPLLRITPDPVVFDTVFCGDTRCIDITLRNTGDTTLTIQEFDAPVSPFTGIAPDPMTLPPGASQTIRWCYAPERVRARDSIRVRYISDNRIPYSFGILVDAGAAMRAAFPDAESGIAAAHDALAGFIGTMMEDGSPPHEAAVFSYSATAQFRLLRGLTEQRALVLSSLPSTAGGTHSCVWHGMDRALSLLPGARHRQILLVINASEDAGLSNCGPYSAPGVTSAALASDVVVCAISLNGAAGTALASVAAQTGGFYRSVASSSELGQAIDDLMQHLRRAVRQHLLLQGEVVSPALAFAPEALLLPATAAGDTSHAGVWLRNVGTAPMDIEAVTGQTPEFTVGWTSRTVPPGDSLLMDVRYHPTNQSFHTAGLQATINGCEPVRPTLMLHAQSFLPVHPDPGPVLATGPDAIDGGDIRCDVGGTIDIPLRNAGSGVLRAFDPVAHCGTLAVTGASVWDLGAGDTSAMQMQVLRGRPPGADSCVVSVRTRGRITTSTVFVLDASTGLRAPWQGLDGIAAARLALDALMADMTATEELHDRLAVLRATRGGVDTLLSWTTDRAAIAALTPAADDSDTTAVLDAVAAALDILDGQPGIPRLVLLTAGGQDASALRGFPDPDSLGSRAIARGVRITALFIGAHAPSPPLQTFLVASGADEHQPMHPPAVAGEMRNLARAAVDTLRHEWRLRWNSRSSDLSHDPATLRFDRSHVGATDCRTLAVTNTGDAPLIIHDITSTAPGFSHGASLPLTVPVGTTANLSLCYEPATLGPWSITAMLRSNSCVRDLIGVPLLGDATDSNTVRISGAFAARPGGLVSIPLHFDHALPASFDVRRMTLRIAYEPSLLYPDIAQPFSLASGAQIPPALTMTQEYDELRGRAVTTYDLVASDGTPFISAGPTHAFGTLRMRAYLGRTLTTDIELLDADFPDHAVALGHAGQANLRLDSMLWLDQRLLDASALWGVLDKIAPNPSPGRSTVGFTLREARTVRLALYDLHGRLLRVVTEGMHSAGTHTAVLETQRLPAGVYAVRLESDTGALVRMMLVNAKEVTR